MGEEGSTRARLLCGAAIRAALARENAGVADSEEEEEEDRDTKNRARACCAPRATSAADRRDACRTEDIIGVTVFMHPTPMQSTTFQSFCSKVGCIFEKKEAFLVLSQSMQDFLSFTPSTATCAGENVLGRGLDHI